jgi:hypothetical protein
MMRPNRPAALRRPRPDPESRRRAFASEIYRQELGRHWQPRGLTKRDRLEITRRDTPAWP